uniref:Uncharacterized protein n=1 Tax=Panagrolaimus davidi TaxID=227884 RepID=A0A914PT23_9BILA
MAFVGSDNDLAIGEMKYTQNGYEKRMFCLTPEMQEKNVERFRQQIIGDKNPKKIILYSNTTGSPFFKMLRNVVLKSKELIAIENNLKGYIGRFVAETIKWVKDNCYTQFHIIPTTITEFTITSKPENFEKPLIIVYPGEKLPLSKQFVVEDSNNVYVYFNTDKTTRELLYTLESSENEPVKKVTFNVDNDGFPTCGFKPFEDINDCMEGFAEILNKLLFTLPVVVLIENYSIISIKENDKYKGLDEWNGKIS